MLIQWSVLVAVIENAYVYVWILVSLSVIVHGSEVSRLARLGNKQMTLLEGDIRFTRGGCARANGHNGSESRNQYTPNGHNIYPLCLLGSVRRLPAMSCTRRDVYKDVCTHAHVA